MAVLFIAEYASGQVQKFVADRHKEVEAELTRLDQERQKLRGEAAAAHQAGQTARRHQQAFWRAAILLLTALALSAAAGLFQKKLLWLAVVAIGVAGLAFLVNAFFLWV